MWDFLALGDSKLKKFAPLNIAGATSLLVVALLSGCTSGPDEYAKDACRQANLLILFDGGSLSSEFELFTTASRSDDAAIKAAGQKGEIGAIVSDSGVMQGALAQLVEACKTLNL